MKVKRGSVLSQIYRNESAAAALLAPLAIISLIFANSSSWLTNLLAQKISLGSAISFSISEWISEGALVIFFFVAGMELRNEVRWGVLSSWRSALLPIAGAAGGMATPALLYLLFSKVLAISPAGWGVPMATDLPIALAVLAIFGKGLPSSLRGFLLALAIADDVGSVIVIALGFTSHFSLQWILTTLALVIFYALATRFLNSGLLATLIALIGWLAVVKSGIHPTVYGVLLGLVTPGSSVADSKKVSAEELLEIWSPISSFIIVPLFVFASLAIPLTFTKENFSDPITWSIVVARLIGKPIGIFLAVLLALKITRVKSELTLGNYFLVGILGTLGLSVSLLFAQLSLESKDLTPAIIGIIATIPLAIFLSAGSLIFLSKRARPVVHPQGS